MNEKEKVIKGFSKEELIHQQFAVLGTCVAQMGIMLKDLNIGAPTYHIALSEDLRNFAMLCNELGVRIEATRGRDGN